MKKTPHVVEIKEVTYTSVIVWGEDDLDAENIAEDLMNESVIDTVSGFHEYERECSALRIAEPRDFKNLTAYNGPEAARSAVCALVENFIEDCKLHGGSDFKVWCEDCLEDEEQSALAERLYEAVNTIADILY